MSEVQRYHVQLFKLSGEQQKYAHGALGAVEVVRASDFDAHVTRLQAENAALQQRLNVADQRVDELQICMGLKDKGITFRDELIREARETCYRELPNNWMAKARACSGPHTTEAAKVDCGNCAFVDGVCSNGCETQRIRAAQQ